MEFEKLENPDLTPDLAFIQYFIREFGIAFLPVSKFYYN